jgi:mannose-1-phosphate guanylyltransferase
VSNRSLWGVVLAGGGGTRFWPLSTPSRPKQFLPLVTDEPLLVDTVRRFPPLVAPERTLIVTGAAFVDAVRAVVAGVPAKNVLGEPKPAGTAAALAWAARVIVAQDPDGVMCCVHADWAVADPDTFRETLSRAAELAVAHDALVTVGVVPSRPDPGFGYILTGDPVSGGAHTVARFHEKPTREHANDLIASGALWNSGIFVWRAARFLEEVARRTPEIASALQAPSGDSATFFGAVREPISVDVGVLERSDNVLVVPGTFGWDDVGTWASLRRVRPLDADGNATHGDAVLCDARGNVVHAMHGTVILFGVDDLVVVTRGDLTVVTTIERAPDLKELLSTLRPSLRDQS